jgi:hypothetical protein
VKKPANCPPGAKCAPAGMAAAAQRSVGKAMASPTGMGVAGFARGGVVNLKGVKPGKTTRVR